jgi:hypothetical protein
VAKRDGDGNIFVRGDETSPPLYRRILHRAIEILIGFRSQSAVTRMLFSDPQRCFWIWDDLAERPLSRRGDVLWLAVGMSLAGAWMIVFTLAAAGVIDAGLSPTLVALH